MIIRRFYAWWGCGLLMLLSGCGQLLYRINNHPPAEIIPNPVVLAPLDETVVWKQVVDSVDDYFRIAREQPLASVEGVVVEGQLETSYRVGASVFEPWRKDSTSGFEKLQSTFQSIRRRAIVTVRPQLGAVADPYGSMATVAPGQTPGFAQGSVTSISGYLIEVVVQKDLEDTDQSQFAIGGAATAARHDGTVIRQEDRLNGLDAGTLGWISLGRDTLLEQRILQDILGRLTPH
ncbi:MAG: hypothetical protein AAF664_09605 [Planctomycetota bacterium]